MTTGEALYLALVLAAFFAFMATLAWVSHGSHTQEASKHRSADQTDHWAHAAR